MMDMYREAIQDLVDGMRLAPLWLAFGWDQMISRFRRTVLGPFWLAANLFMVALSLTVLWGGLTGQGTKTLFATVVTGLLSWSLIGGPITDASNAFISATSMMQSQKLPVSFHIYLAMFRNFINFAAQLLALWVVFLLFRVGGIPAWPILISLPLVLVDMFLISLIVSIPSTRFRDVNQLIAFAVQIVMFLTPVFWSRSQMNGRYVFLVDYNPLAHLLELIRQPLIGRYPSMVHFEWAILLMVLLSGVAITLLALYRRRIIYWL